MNSGILIPSSCSNLKGSKKGIVFWQSVSNRKSSLDYAKEVASKTFEGITGEMLQHCKELSDVCIKKYRKLSFAMQALAGGILFLIIALYLA